MKSFGILGGGQLARMMALAGHSLGLSCRVWDPNDDAPASSVAQHICADWDDPNALNEFCDGLDVATIEFEAVPMSTAKSVASRLAMYPSPRALSATADRLGEKEFAKSLGIRTAPFARVENPGCIGLAFEKVGCPAIFKTRTQGYDGKGQFVVSTVNGAKWAWENSGRRVGILEGFVPFSRELSLVCVRAKNGNIAFYPIVENLHRGGILQKTTAPATNVSEQMQSEAQSQAKKVLEALEYVGVLTLEYFDVDGDLVLNEIAPRVHNSGHWTIEASETSQFENHVRSITGLPLGSTSLRCPAVMRNLIGKVPNASLILNIDGAHLHLYGKEPREGRKLGHVTVTSTASQTLDVNDRALATLLNGDQK